MKVYVDKLPESIELCPFANQSNKKCSMTNDKCCLEKGAKCDHLITLEFGFDDEGGK